MELLIEIFLFSSFTVTILAIICMSLIIIKDTYKYIKKN